MSWMQEYVKIKEAARILGLSPDTVRKRIAEGRLPQTRRLGGAFSSPILIHLADLRAMLRVGRDIGVAGAIGIDKASDEIKFQELNARCLKLADALGSPDAIVKALQDVGGVDRLSDLDPELYARFRTRLIRLANPMTGGTKGANGRFQKRIQPEPWELVKREAA